MTIAERRAKCDVILIILGVFVLVTVLIVLTVPSIINVDRYRPQIEAKLKRKARTRGEARHTQAAHHSTFGFDREHYDRRVSAVSFFASLCSGEQRGGKRRVVLVVARRTGTPFSFNVASLN